jgi:hypothetical protein
MTFLESWLGKTAGATGLAGSSNTPDHSQHLFVAGPDGFVKSLDIGPPDWKWSWGDRLMDSHDGIVGLAAYYHSGDNRQHIFVALRTGDVWESLFLPNQEPRELHQNWLGKLDGGAVGLAGFSTAQGNQHLFIAGQDGFLHPLEIGPLSSWQWTWRDPMMSHHDGLVGLTAYFHPGDDRQHVFAALTTGDIWEGTFRPGEGWRENWLGKLDGGAIGLAGHSAPNGTQHLFVAAAGGLVFPLQIGPPQWKWRWNDPIMSQHDEIVGLAAYYHSGDNRHHVFAALRTGDIWESRFALEPNVEFSEWKPTTFPISYWWGPPSDDMVTERYQQVADAGFTFAMPPGTLAVDANLRFLDAAGATRLKAFIADERLDQVVQRALTMLDDSAKQTLDEVIAAYSGHSALAGYHLRDEPSATLFPSLASLVSYFRDNDPGHACFMNLFPIHAGSENFGIATYEDYVGSYINIVKPFAVSYDHYSLLADGSDEPTFFRNLHVIRDKSIAAGLPFWQIILAIPHWNYRSPTAAEKRFEVMQTMAFGGRAVLYFTYWSPPADDPNYVGWGTGIVNRDGTPSLQYDEVRRINADVRTLGKYLIQAQSTLVFENGSLPDGGTPPPPNAPVRLLSAADITVGMFWNAPYRYALLASRDYRHVTSSDAVFTAQGLQRLDKTSGAWLDIDTSYETHVVLAPGDAELYRLI